MDDCLIPRICVCLEWKVKYINFQNSNHSKNVTKKLVTKAWREGIRFAHAFFCLILSCGRVFSSLLRILNLFLENAFKPPYSILALRRSDYFPSFRYSTALFRREVQIGGNLSRSLVRHKNIDCEVEFEAWFIFLRLCIRPRDEIPMHRY